MGSCHSFFLLSSNRLSKGFIAVLQADKPDSLFESLHLEGLDFNWSVSIVSMLMGKTANQPMWLPRGALPYSKTNVLDKIADLFHHRF